ncbi:MAG: winged helix-turn-helix domain-containing protein [Candidatus Sericytochromatia bacterium]|uniref:Winged helix-turn-helix domain-containing protein n=1 Tax=Candidatus Tanganyikabacteria bacterium TaxID=2961651 RepID=A0A938BKT7_9BACT|nr:winged helix-turn-helix domain-containing protein [Candidatus Tanganyikabacteria bacterium]
MREHFGVSYHNQHFPRLLHQLGFSVQRPRKRLARADTKAQAGWLNERLSEIKKAAEVRGVIVFKAGLCMRIGDWPFSSARLRKIG